MKISIILELEKPKYRPLFLEHFDRKNGVSTNANQVSNLTDQTTPEISKIKDSGSSELIKDIYSGSINVDEQQHHQSHAKIQATSPSKDSQKIVQSLYQPQYLQQHQINEQQRQNDNQAKMQRNFIDGENFEFVYLFMKFFYDFVIITILLTFS